MANDRDIKSLLKTDAYKGLKKFYKLDEMVRVASEVQAHNVPCISTGNFEWDAALGGGLRHGCMHTLYGPVSSGKTYSLLKIIASAQKSCSRCWMLTEMCVCSLSARKAMCMLILTEDWDRKWAEAIGVDCDQLLLTEPSHGEEGLDSADVLMRSGKLDVIAVDSLAFLTPAAEIKESVGKDHMGIQPRMLGQFIRKFMSGLRAMSREGEHPTFLGVNQVRMNLAVMFGNPETKPGGNAPQFAATTETRFGRIEVFPKKPKIGERPLYGLGKFRVSKNKQFEPNRTGEYQIIFQDSSSKKRGDLEDEYRMLAQGKRLEAIAQEGKKWMVLGREFKKQDLIEEALRTDPAFKYELRETLIALMTAT